MSLPHEIFKEIFGLVQEDKSSLSACSLVAKSWSLPAQENLFHSVHLTPRNVPKKIHADYDGLEIPDLEAIIPFMRDRLDLVCSVRELQIEGIPVSKSVANYGDWSEITQLLDSEPQLNYIRLSLEVVSSIVKLLPCLKWLVLTNLVIETTPLPPYDIIPLDILDLQTVGFHAAGQMFDVFQVFRPGEIRIEYFYNHHISQLTSGLDKRNMVTPSWVIRYPGIVTDTLLFTPFVQHGTFLDVTVERKRELFLLVELLEVCGANLHTFKLGLLHNGHLYYGPLPTNIDRSFLRRLNMSQWKSLDMFELTIISRDGRHRDFAARVGRLILATLPSTIREVRLVIDIDKTIPVVEVLHQVPWTSFSEGLTRARKMRRVIIVISVVSGATDQGLSEDAVGDISRMISEPFRAVAQEVHVEYK